MSDRVLIYKRREGYPISELWKYRQSCQPLEDDLISLSYVVRVCHDGNLPYSSSQIKRLFRQLYSKELHGSKAFCWKHLSKYLFHKNIRIIPIRKVGSLHGKQEQKASVMAYNSQSGQLGGSND